MDKERASNDEKTMSDERSKSGMLTELRYYWNVHKEDRPYLFWVAFPAMTIAFVIAELLWWLWLRWERLGELRRPGCRQESPNSAGEQVATVKSRAKKSGEGKDTGHKK